jgi:hypothetical protein
LAEQARTLDHVEPLCALADDSYRHALRVKQTILKTITFRIVLTSPDFSANYFVIGNAGTPAGSSAISLQRQAPSSFSSRNPLELSSTRSR